MIDGSSDTYAFALLSSDDDTSRSPRSYDDAGHDSNYAIRPYSKQPGYEAAQMREEIKKLENQLAIATRATIDSSDHVINRSDPIAKYVCVMEVTKSLRRKKEYLLNENRKRQRFAEKIQKVLSATTENVQFTKKISFPSTEELQCIAREAFKEMCDYTVNCPLNSYFGWETKRVNKAMYLHTYSQKSFPNGNLSHAFNETWTLHHDETRQKTLFRRRSNFRILKKVNDSMYLTRNVHQFVGEVFERHAMTLVFHIAVDSNNFAIVSKSIMPASNDAENFVWTDECMMWYFSRRLDKDGGFDVSIRGRYGSTSNFAGLQLPMLESYFFLVDWECLVIQPIFKFE